MVFRRIYTIWFMLGFNLLEFCKKFCFTVNALYSLQDHVVCIGRESSLDTNCLIVKE